MVEPAFVSLAEPSVPAALERCRLLGATKIVVVPYFLFTGVLVDRIADRLTVPNQQSIVVFLIGMRVNKWWRFDKWFPVASAMGPMLQTLFTHPEKGFLHAEFFWNFNGPVLIQYWRSFEDLERFARHPSDPHLAAWKKFNQAVGADGSVGIWHETYTVNPDQFALFSRQSGPPPKMFAGGTADLPSFTTERMYSLVSELWHAGLRDVARASGRPEAVQALAERSQQRVAAGRADQRDAGGTAVDDRAQSDAMAFAEGGDPEEMAETVM